MAPNGPLFAATTFFGVVSWVMSATMVLTLKRTLGVSLKSTAEIALYTTWLTSVGAAPSLAAVALEEGAVPGEAPAARIARAAGRALVACPPLVALYVIYMLLQAGALLFVSATVACLDSYAAMVLATAALTSLLRRFFSSAPRARGRRVVFR